MMMYMFLTVLLPGVCVRAIGLPVTVRLPSLAPAFGELVFVVRNVTGFVVVGNDNEK